MNEYVYSTISEKLSIIHRSSTEKRTDYVGNMIYENGSLKRILVEGGYIEGGVYYFYIQDHLGNNRVVANASGTIVQSNHFYPYGMSFTEGIQTLTQPFKFGGKELDIQKGLNWYDSQARMQDPVIPMFPTMDPMAEKYYSWSPYGYSKSNPMNRIDPDGKDDYLVNTRGRLWNLTPEAERGKSRSDRLYNVSYSGKERGNKSIEVSDTKLLSNMVKLQNGDEYQGRRTAGSTENLDDAANVFKFVADNSKVEWRLDVYDDNGTKTAVIATKQDEDNVQGANAANKDLGVKGKQIVDMHSHPYAKGTMGGSPVDISNAKPSPTRNVVYFKGNQTLYEYNRTRSQIKEMPAPSSEELLKQMGLK